MNNYLMFFDNEIVSISKNGLNICYGYLDDGLYFIRPIRKPLLNIEMFKVVEPKSKKQNISHKDDAYLWHLRLSHININRIERVTKDEGPLRRLKVSSLPVYESFLEGKLTKRSFSTKGEKAKEPLGLIHYDACGPLNVQERGGYEYFVTFIDDYSRNGYAYLMQRKSKTFGKFKEFNAEVEKRLGNDIKIIRPDQGGEYLDTKFIDFLMACGFVS